MSWVNRYIESQSFYIKDNEIHMTCIYNSYRKTYLCSVGSGVASLSIVNDEDYLTYKQCESYEECFYEYVLSALRIGNKKTFYITDQYIIYKVKVPEDFLSAKKRGFEAIIRYKLNKKLIDRETITHISIKGLFDMNCKAYSTLKECSNAALLNKL
jgi:hypothetical protein